MSGLTQEFLVVLLAGGVARRLKPLTENIPKCLLPVANRPLLSYQFDFLSKAGFKEVILITTTSFEEVIQDYVALVGPEMDLKVNVKVIDDFMGTAACLLKIKDRVKGHVIVMSSDIIVEDQFLHYMADLHRARDAAVTILTYPEPPPPESGGAVSRDKNKVLDFIGLDPKDDRLVYSLNSNDLENNEMSLKVRKSLLRRFPNFTLHTDLNDAHFYMFSKWTLDLLEQNKQIIQNVKSHFIPFLVKCQLRRKMTEALSIPNVISPEAYSMSSSSYNLNDRIKCFVWQVQNNNQNIYCLRVTDINSYINANREIASGEKSYVPLEPQSEGKQKYYMASSAQVHHSSQITSGCVVGDGSQIGERVAVKKSIIGKHCVVANNAKILNSVILDHVIIGEGSKIQNTIIGPNSYIDPQCTLTDCLLGAGCRVVTGSTFTGKKISTSTNQ